MSIKYVCMGKLIIIPIVRLQIIRQHVIAICKHSILHVYSMLEYISGKYLWVNQPVPHESNLLKYFINLSICDQLDVFARQEVFEY